MYADKSLPVKARKSSRSPLNPVEFQGTLRLIDSNGHVCCHHRGAPVTNKKSFADKKKEKLEKRSPGEIDASIKQKGSNIKRKTSCKNHNHPIKLVSKLNIYYWCTRLRPSSTGDFIECE